MATRLENMENLEKLGNLRVVGKSQGKAKVRKKVGGNVFLHVKKVVISSQWKSILELRGAIWDHTMLLAT